MDDLPAPAAEPVDPRALARRIGDLATLHAELATFLRATGGAAGKGRSAGLSLEEEVVTAREHIVSWLRSWAAVVLEEHVTIVRGPWAWGLAAKVHLAPPTGDNAYVVATWLRRHVRWISAQPWAAECAANLDTTITEALHARQLTRVRRFTIDLPDGAALCPARAEGPQHATPAPPTARHAPADRVLPTGYEHAGEWLLAPHPICGGKLVGWVRDDDTRGLPSTIRCELDPQHAWPATAWHSLGRQVQPLDSARAGRVLAALFPG